MLELTGPAYRYQGCYDDSTGPFLGGTRTLPQVLDNFRMGVGVDECAAAARSRGFPVFALQGYGQCFFGSMADVARLQATQKLSDDSCSNLPCPPNAATCPGNINKVYFLLGALPHYALFKFRCQAMERLHDILLGFWRGMDPRPLTRHIFPVTLDNRGDMSSNPS